MTGAAVGAEFFAASVCVCCAREIVSLRLRRPPARPLVRLDKSETYTKRSKRVPRQPELMLERTEETAVGIRISTSDYIYSLLSRLLSDPA